MTTDDAAPTTDDEPTTPDPVDPERSPERRRIEALAKEYRDDYRHHHLDEE